MDLARQGITESCFNPRPIMVVTDGTASGPSALDLPIDDATFAALMSRLEPFESSPVVAVAVSGGPDSMALCLLADRWAVGQGGAVLALTVDHRLRPDSTEEAKTVARWLGERRINHRVLSWDDGREGLGAGSIQAAARTVRYDLLEQACAASGILHLLLAHTLEDQAETVLLRLSKGSGVDGLAAMAPVRETAEIRLLRPLLGVNKRQLLATCREFRQGWVDDPSNSARQFARGRLRRVSTALADEGLSPARLSDTARRAGRARTALDAAATALLARTVSMYPEGYATLDRAQLMDAPEEFVLRALSRCLLAVGAGDHPPRLDRLERLYQALRSAADAGGRTLAGCRVVPGRTGRLLICREPAATEVKSLVPPVDTPPAPITWDDRFRITPPAGRLPAGLEVRRLGVIGRAALRSEGMAADRLPAIAALSLPGVWDGERLFGLPKFVTLQRTAISCKLARCGVRFIPSRRLTDPAFAVA